MTPPIEILAPESRKDETEEKTKDGTGEEKQMKETFRGDPTTHHGTNKAEAGRVIKPRRSFQHGLVVVAVVAAVATTTLAMTRASTAKWRRRRRRNLFWPFPRTLLLLLLLLLLLEGEGDKRQLELGR